MVYNTSRPKTINCFKVYSFCRASSVTRQCSESNKWVGDKLLERNLKKLERKNENGSYCSRIKNLALDLSFVFNTHLCNSIDNHVYLEYIRVSYQAFTAVVAQTAVFWVSKPRMMFVMTFRRNVLLPSAGYGINFSLTLKCLTGETGRL